LGKLAITTLLPTTTLLLGLFWDFPLCSLLSIRFPLCTLYTLYTRCTPYRTQLLSTVLSHTLPHSTTLSHSSRLTALTTHYLCVALLLTRYQGFYASDAGNVGALVNARVAFNATDAASIALSAGMDQTMGGGLSPTITLPGMASGEISASDVERACANVLTAKFAAGLFDGALPDPANAGLLDTPAHRALAREAAEQGAVLLVNNQIPSDTATAAVASGATVAAAASHTSGKGRKKASSGTRPALPLRLDSIKHIAVIGPNSGCPATGPPPPPPPPPPPGQCGHTTGVDCPGSDVTKINNVTSWNECCTLCLAHPECTVAVLATDAFGGQCMMKSSCDAPTTMPNRIIIDTGRTPPVKPHSKINPWDCLALRAMVGG
jgi:hypothetical protein